MPSIKNLGLFCLPGRGHLYPAVALGKRLRELGYTVTVFNRAVAKAIVCSAGLNFKTIEDNSAGITFGSRSRSPVNDAGINSLDVIYSNARLVLQHGPRAVAETRMDALLVDQAELGAGSVADLLGIPFVTLSFVPPVYLHDEAPPFIFNWQPQFSPAGIRRNRKGNTLLGVLVKPVLEQVNDQRRIWNLVPFQNLNDVFSRLAIISQLPEAFDFPRACRPSNLYYTGPFTDPAVVPKPDFPWHKLNGKRIVYACMGTVRNDSIEVFKTIAQACAKLDVQLVISFGGMDWGADFLGAEETQSLAVYYAPQTDILQKAALTICHAGINTTLESISNGVPIVAIPIADDQPGVAARIEWRGLGRALPRRRLSAADLQARIEAVLEGPAYYQASRELQTQIASNDGLAMAAGIIQTIFSQC